MSFGYVLRYDLERTFFVLKRITPDPFIIMSSTSRALNYGWGFISRRAAYLPTSRWPGPAADRILSTVPYSQTIHTMWMTGCFHRWNVMKCEGRA